MLTIKRLLNNRYSDVQYRNEYQRVIVIAIDHNVAKSLPGIARAYNLSKYGVGHIVVVFAKEY